MMISNWSNWSPWFMQKYSALSGLMTINRPLGYERVYLRLCKVADTPFHIQGGEVLIVFSLTNPYYILPVCT